MSNYRSRMLEPRERFISVRTTDDEVEFFESALLPGESRTQFMVAAATALAYKRLKARKNKSK